MGSQTGLVLYVLVAGFVAAGLLNALHPAIVGENRQDSSPVLELRFDTPASIAWSMIVCVFAGPYLLVRNSYQFWRLDILTAPALLVCLVLSAIWSFCSGVVIVETALALASI